ncbi:Ubiquitin fusion degradation protein 4 [Actinomortierella wolfii]|nr:Ubiquitin fusion degradation protein 4 [Actinomortierella wolfii]
MLPRSHFTLVHSSNNSTSSTRNIATSASSSSTGTTCKSTPISSPAITRQQTKLSLKARQDYLSFASGLESDKHLTTSSININLNSGSGISSKNSLPPKRPGSLPSQSTQPKRFKHSTSSTPPKNNFSPSFTSEATPKRRAKQHLNRSSASKGIGSFMRQSKMSTLQGRPLNSSGIKSGAPVEPNLVVPSHAHSFSPDSQDDSASRNHTIDTLKHTASDSSTGTTAQHGGADAKGTKNDDATMDCDQESLEPQLTGGPDSTTVPDEGGAGKIEHGNSQGAGHDGDNENEEEDVNCQNHKEKDNKDGDENADDEEVDEEEEDADEEDDEEEEEEEDDEAEEDEDEEEEDEDDDYNHSSGDGLFSSGGAMSGMVSGVSSRLKSILTNLRAYEDPTMQLIALQDLAVLLSVSTEDTLAGYISCDAFVKELVRLMRGEDDGGDNPEMMLLACRCLSNLMEAMPTALGSVVYGGAIPVLCSKLLEIQYIDVAEQSLSTLEKISAEYPQAVVKEGGLAAVLMFLDFFSTNVQRTAVKTAANCCRGFPHDSIGMVMDILPNLENIIQYSDQKIAEQVCLCFVRLADSFKTNTAHLEMDIVDTVFLILTGGHVPPTVDGDNSASLKIPTIVQRPKDQLFEILGLISELLPALPQDDLFDIEMKHKEKEIKDATAHCESAAEEEDVEMEDATGTECKDRRAELLATHPARYRRFGRVLVPTLIEVYSSAVNLKVRQRAIHALVKVIYFAEADQLKVILHDIELASFIAVILSQQEHQSLVIASLQIVDLLMTKLPSVYRFYFEREGVTYEISKIAQRGAEVALAKKVADQARQRSSEENGSSASGINDSVTGTDQVISTGGDQSLQSSAEHPSNNSGNTSSHLSSGQRLTNLMTELRQLRSQHSRDAGTRDQLATLESELSSVWEQYSQQMNRSSRSGGTESDSSSTSAETNPFLAALRLFGDSMRRMDQPHSSDATGLGSGKPREWIFERSQIIMNKCEAYKQSELTSEKGQILLSVLDELKALSKELEGPEDQSLRALSSLAKLFRKVGLNGISSFEFLNSGIHEGLLKLITRSASSLDASFSSAPIRVFVQEFMTIDPAVDGATTTTPFGILLKKLQESLTRMESFVVDTAQSPADESRRNPSSSLASQIRLKLTPEEGTQVPPGYQNLIVSIHAIATFRTLDEYLRPRLKILRSSSVNNKSPHTTSRSKTTPGATPRRSTRLRQLAHPDQDNDDKSEKSADDGDGDIELKDAAQESRDSSGEGCRSDLEEENENVFGEEEAFEHERPRRHSLQSSMDLDESSPKNGDVSMLNTTASTQSRNASPAPSTGSNRSLTNDHTRHYLEDSTWHIQFSINGIPIDTDTTVYGAIREYERQSGISSNGSTYRTFWSNVYPIKYKRVEMPPPQPISLGGHAPKGPATDITFSSEMPPQLSQKADYAPILGLLRVLHGLNDNWRQFFDANDTPQGTVLKLRPQEFENSKIAAKVNRQLEEPLIVASSCLPGWTIGLVTGFPFLFPFETRYTYLQSTSFGFSRCLMRWQSQQQRSGSTDQRDDSQPFLGRIQRQKVRISRQRALESAVRVMELYGSNQAMLEVEYFEEVGTGLGPTLEFYAVVSKEFCKRSLKLWRETDSGSKSDYVFSPLGLFPRPMATQGKRSDNDRKILQLFRAMGQFVAKAMLDSRIIDISFNTMFISKLLNRVKGSGLQLVEQVDPVLAKSFSILMEYVTEKKRIYGLNLPSKEREAALKAIRFNNASLEDMSLDFTLPGYPDIELKPEGSKIPVTIYNVEEYVNLAVDMTVGSGIEAQVEAFQTGFNRVFSIYDLSGFSSEELVRMFGSVEEDWSLETLTDTVKADHGFRSESRAFRNLLEIMSEYTTEERRQFLQFITGSPKLPIGGFKNLHPPFTVVCKPYEAPLKADDYLPSVMTCANYLKMPDYSSKAVMRRKIEIAMNEGQGSFHLS